MLCTKTAAKLVLCGGRWLRMRDRLIELLENAPRIAFSRDESAEIANYLIENGVIVGGGGNGVPGAARPTDMGVRLYLEFRAELDKICVPAIVRTLDFIEHIKYEGQIVGFIGGNSGYIDSLYVMPRHRRKGLAKRAVLDWYRKYARPYENVRLHIITDNAPAQAFWRSIFELHKIGGDEVDELYEIIREKEGE